MNSTQFLAQSKNSTNACSLAFQSPPEPGPALIHIQWSSGPDRAQPPPLLRASCTFLPSPCLPHTLAEALGKGTGCSYLTVSVAVSQGNLCFWAHLILGIRIL